MFTRGVTSVAAAPVYPAPLNFSRFAKVNATLFEFVKVLGLASITAIFAFVEIPVILSPSIVIGKGPVPTPVEFNGKLAVLLPKSQIFCPKLDATIKSRLRAISISFFMNVVFKNY